MSYALIFPVQDPPAGHIMSAAGERSTGARMDVYHGWFDLKPGARDLEVTAAIERYLGHLRAQGQIAGWRLMRRKLGLAPRELGEFHLMMEFDDLAQLERAFAAVSTRADPVEALHHAVNSQVTNVRFALYRDFPDPQRRTGEERF